MCGFYEKSLGHWHTRSKRIVKNNYFSLTCSVFWLKTKAKRLIYYVPATMNIYYLLQSQSFPESWLSLSLPINIISTTVWNKAAAVHSVKLGAK